MHFNDEDVTQQAHQGPDHDLQEVPIMGGDLPQFGDYVEIEQKRFKGDNEFYTYKVIGTLRSNMWVDVPVVAGGVEDPRDEMADVVSCICCGVAEYTVKRFRVSDVRFKKDDASSKGPQDDAEWFEAGIEDALNRVVKMLEKRIEYEKNRCENEELSEWAKTRSGNFLSCILEIASRVVSMQNGDDGLDWLDHVDYASREGACSFPDCGCASARVCFEGDPNPAARAFNFETGPDLIERMDVDK